MELYVLYSQCAYGKLLSILADDSQPLYIVNATCICWLKGRASLFLDTESIASMILHCVSYSSQVTSSGQVDSFI